MTTRGAMDADLLVMGMPRSGTTLLAALIDSAPAAVCLSEPPLPRAFSVVDSERFADLLAEDVAAIRDRVAAGEPVVDVGGEGGERLTNYVARSGGESLRVARRRKRRAVVAGPDFTLAIKHNGCFLATLPALRARPQWRTVAVVRHPHASFAAWLASGMPIARGRFAPVRWPETAAIAADPSLSLPERLAHVYAAVARRLAVVPPWRLIRYEALVAAPGAALDTIGVAGADLALVAAPPCHRDGGDTVAEALAALRAIDDGSVRRLYEF